MKVKVKESFRDKYTKENYKKGQIIEVAQKRFEEINSSRFGVLIEAVPEKPEKKETPKK